MNWIIGIGIGTLAVLLLALAVNFGIFLFLLGRPKRSTRVPDFYKDSPHYQVSRAGMALMDTLAHEDKYMTSRDGLRLHAHFFPTGDNPKKFVLGIHGYKSYARPEFGPYIDFYRSLGYSMLLPDDRAHGPSEGSYIGFGVLDRLDTVDWARWITEQYGEDVQILLHGVSMGSATVLAASGEEALPPQVFGTVADCGYTAAWEIIDYQLRKMNKLLPKLVMPTCEMYCRLLAGYDFHSHTPIEQIKKARVPILFVHGGKDTMVPAWMLDRLYEACTGKKRKLLIPEAGHAESIALAPEAYHSAIREFFDI